MQVTMIGNIFIENPRRMAGTFQIAYDVTTPSGKTGIAVFHYEYNKRDIVTESLTTTPEIADEMREFLGGDPDNDPDSGQDDIDSPSSCDCFKFPVKEHTNENPDKVRQALEVTTVLVYDYS